MPKERDILIVFDASRSSMDPWTDPAHMSEEMHPYFVHELLAARAFLTALDPNGAAVGFAAFAGDLPGSGARRPPAWTEAPLTEDLAQLGRVLDELETRPHTGNSHLAAGIDQGTIELVALRGALSTPRLGARPAMLILNDGEPNLPYGPKATRENVVAEQRALDRARRAGIACYLIAFGRDTAALDPLREAVEATGGSYFHAEDPAHLVDVVSQVARRLAPAATAPEPPSDPFVAMAGKWGYTDQWSSNADAKLGCSGNPHVISFSPDQTTMTVRYEQPVDRGDGTPRREITYAVVERRANFLRLEEARSDRTDAGKPRAQRFAVEALSDSYCIGYLCAERCSESAGSR